MTAAEAALLGALQGLTEFLPVSSSGHLVLGEHLLSAPLPGVTFEVAAHLGTTLAVLLHYRRWLVATTVSLLRGRRGPLTRYFLLLLLATVPAALAGILLGDPVKSLFDRPLLVCLCLAVTGALLLATSAARAGRRRVGIREALVIGAAQAVALLPGISRSGSTIAAGLFSGVRRRRAAKFAFLLSVPAVLGACVLEVLDLPPLSAGEALPLATGAAVAFLTGLFSLRAMLVLTARGRLPFFGLYCLAVALLGALFLR